MRYAITDSIERVPQPFTEARHVQGFDLQILEETANLEMQDLEDGKVLHQRVEFMQVAANQVEPGEHSKNFIKESLSQFQHRRIIDPIQRLLDLDFQTVVEIVSGSPDPKSFMVLLH